MKALIISTDEGHALFVLECLAASKVKIYVMGLNNMLRIRLSRYCNGYLTYKLSDLLEVNDNIIDDINGYCKKEKIDTVMSAGMDATLFISKIKERIVTANVFPVSDLETLNMLNNKWKFSEFMTENDIAYPKTILVTDMSQLKSQDLDFPLMIKPLELDANRGVAKLNSFKELETYILHKDEFNKLPLLIQEYIPGYDAGISIMAKNGKVIAWTIQKWHTDRRIIEFIKDDNILNIGKKIASCCNYNGVAHIDMMLDNRDKSVKVLECNPRFWGSIVFSMWCGVNFPYIGMLIARGDTISKDMSYKEIMYIPSRRFIPGILVDKSLRDINKYDFYLINRLAADPLVYICMAVIGLASRFKKIS